MADTLFKAPRAKKSPRQDDYEPPPAMAPKRPRTAEDFLLFCKFILDYENYEMLRHEELRAKSGSPMGSTGSSSDLSTSSRSEGRASQNDRKGSDTETDDDGYYLVTCYCGKPFAKRPMIECSNCLTWIHLSCAKIKKTNIPEVFICIKCRPQANQQPSPASQSPPTSVGSPSPPSSSSSSLYTNGSSRSLMDKKGT